MVAFVASLAQEHSLVSSPVLADLADRIGACLAAARVHFPMILSQVAEVWSRRWQSQTLLSCSDSALPNLATDISTQLPEGGAQVQGLGALTGCVGKLLRVHARRHKPALPVVEAQPTFRSFVTRPARF